MKRLLASFLVLGISFFAFGQVVEIEFISQEISLNTYLYTGKGSGKKPTLLWLHGNPGRKEEGKSKWAVELSEKGINVLKFNYQGLWGNEGEFSLGNALIDLSHAMDFLSSEQIRVEYEIDTSQIFVGGYSFGSNVALIGSMYDDRIKRIIGISLCDHSYFGRQVLDPNSKVRDFIEKAIGDLFLPTGIIKQDKTIFIEDLIYNIYKYDFVTQANKFQNKHLYLFTGLNDINCPIEDHLLPFYRKLMALDHKHLEVTIEMCDHGLNCEPPITLTEILVNCIKK